MKPTTPELGSSAYTALATRLIPLRTAILRIGNEGTQARVDLVTALFEAGVAAPGDALSGAGLLTERDFTSCFEMSDVDDVIKTLIDKAKAAPDSLLAQCVAHHGWWKPSKVQSFADANPVQIDQTVRVNGTYTSQGGKGPAVVFNFAGTGVKAGVDTRGNAVAMMGAHDALMDSNEALDGTTVFIEPWLGSGIGFHDALATLTGVDATVFERIADSWEAGGFEDLHFMLEGVDGAALRDRCITPPAVKQLAVTLAGLVRCSADGQVYAYAEALTDDGLVERWDALLPPAGMPYPNALVINPHTLEDEDVSGMKP